eukprot:gb/GECG01004982.1/.p1 GENE.gb/GECG01004982.1/~~gb/GECG01004982.1/.p1  ORF type:complete len:964 (+),score=151.42 gb/GECG01004982.1/:1-2892(+)
MLSASNSSTSGAMDDQQKQQHSSNAAVVSPSTPPVPPRRGYHTVGRSSHYLRSRYLHKLGKVMPDSSSLFELQVGMGTWGGRSKSSSDISSLQREFLQYAHSSKGAGGLEPAPPDKQETGRNTTAAATEATGRIRAATADTVPDRARTHTLDGSARQKQQQSTKSKTPENRSRNTPKSPYLVPSLTARSGDKLRRGLMTRLQSMPPSSKQRTEAVSCGSSSSQDSDTPQSGTQSSAADTKTDKLDGSTKVESIPSESSDVRKGTKEQLPRFSVAARRATARARRARKRQRARLLRESPVVDKERGSDEAVSTVPYEDYTLRRYAQQCSAVDVRNAKEQKEYSVASSLETHSKYQIAESCLVSNPLSLLDKSSPLWYATKNVRECHSCGTGFSLLVRKHHCRTCGLVMCSDCVPRSTVVCQRTTANEEVLKVLYPPERKEESEERSHLDEYSTTTYTARICHFCRVLSNGSILPMPRILYFLKKRQIDRLKEKIQHEDAEEADRIGDVIRRLTLSMPKQPPEGSATLPRIEHDTTMWLDAVARGDTTEVELRLALGQDVNVQERARGRFALYVAAENNHAELIGLLLSSHEPLVQLTTFDNQTALHIAAAKGYRSIVRLLVKSGVPEGHIDVDGETAIMKAIKNGHYSIAGFLSRENLPENWRAPEDAFRGEQLSRKRIRFSKEELEDRYSKTSLDQRLEEFPQIDISRFYNSMRTYRNSEEDPDEGKQTKMAKPSKAAMALPLPPRDQLLNAGLGVLDPAAQALQANLLAVRNITVQKAQMQQWRLDTSLPDRMSIWEELGFIDSRERFAVPSQRSRVTSGHYETGIVAAAWRLGHSLGSDIDVSEWISQIFQDRNSSSSSDSVGNTEGRHITPKDIAGELFSSASADEEAETSDEDELDMNIQVPLAEEVDAALNLTNSTSDNLQAYSEDDDDLMELLTDDNLDDETPDDEDDADDDEDDEN